MNKNLTEIVLVVDRSGSMSSMCSDAEGGINTLIKKQKEAVGSANLTLVQFDTEYEFIHKGTPIQSVEEYHLVPRGGTALLDAVGKAINETGERLSAIKEEDRPGLVLFAICTDGFENSSREFTKSQIKEMIEHQQSKYNWQFSFLGANQDSFAEAGGIGISPIGTCNFSNANIAYASTGDKFSRMRRQLNSGDIIDNSYTDEEVEAMNQN